MYATSTQNIKKCWPEWFMNMLRQQLRQNSAGNQRHMCNACGFHCAYRAFVNKRQVYSTPATYRRQQIM
eukprot:89528-Amphidinium_carterae.1